MENGFDRAIEFEQHARALLERVDHGYCVVEVLFDRADCPVDYVFLDLNEAFERQTGLSNALGRRMRDMEPGQADHWIEIYGRVARTGEPARFKHRAAALNQVYDAQAFRVGRPDQHRVAIWFTDVTHQIRAELALREREEELHLVMESATDYAIILMDCERRVTRWNSGAQRLTRHAESEIIGQCADILFTPEDREKGAPEREQRIALEKGRALNERWHLRKDGTRFWGSGMLFPLRDPAGHTAGLVKIMRDRTAEVTIQEELRRSEERLRVALDTAELGTWTFDPATDEVRADDRARELFGVPADAGQSIERYLNALHPDDRERVGATIQSAFRGANGGEYRDEFRLVDPIRQRERWVRNAGRVSFDEAGRPALFVGTVFDITDVIEAREVLARRGEELERLVGERTAQLRETVQQLETFSYSVVHDMRAPLRSLRSFSAILTDEYGPRLDDAARSYLGRIRTSAEKMDGLITDVLAYSRVSSTEPNLATVDLHRLVSEIVRDYPQFHECVGCVEIRAPMPQAIGNRALLTQCVSNLIGNALKFVPPGRKPRVVVRAESRSDFVRLWVEDNGIGIEPEFRERIFGLFNRLHTTAEYPGTGVGLAIVRKAAERMRGNAGFESTPGEGSRFWIDLPAVSKP